MPLVTCPHCSREITIGRTRVGLVVCCRFCSGRFETVEQKIPSVAPPPERAKTAVPVSKKKRAKTVAPVPKKKSPGLILLIVSFLLWALLGLITGQRWSDYDLGLWLGFGAFNFVFAIAMAVRNRKTIRAHLPRWLAPDKHFVTAVVSDYVWCVYCERAYKRGKFDNSERCSYSDCRGEGPADRWNWANVRQTSPQYPEIPTRDVRYSFSLANNPKSPQNRIHRMLNIMAYVVACLACFAVGGFLLANPQSALAGIAGLLCILAGIALGVWYKALHEVCGKTDRPPGVFCECRQSRMWENLWVLGARMAMARRVAMARRQEAWISLGGMPILPCQT